MKKIEILKRMAAGTLAVAIIALGTSCGKTTETTDSTAPIVSTDENKVKLEDIKDVKPIYEEGIISEKEIQVSTKLNEVVKSMINEDKYFAKNFDYYVERLTITDVKIEALENAVMPDYAGVDYAPSADKSKVTISYIADAVNKKTGEKTTESNAISYVVNSTEVANLASAEPEEIEFETMAQAVAEGTQEKLEEVAQGQTEEEDKVEGRQSNLSSWFYKEFLVNLIDKVYEEEHYKNLLDNGYTLTSVSRRDGQLSTNHVIYEEEVTIFKEEFMQDKFSQYLLSYENQNCYISFVQNDYVEGYSMRILCDLYTLATNKATGDQKLIYNTILFDTYLDRDFVVNIIDNALSKSVVNVDKVREQTKKEENEFGTSYKFNVIINGEEGFTSDIISTMKDIAFNRPNSYERLWLDGFSEIMNVEDVNDYKQKIIIASLADKNNTDVFIKEPNN